MAIDSSACSHFFTFALERSVKMLRMFSGFKLVARAFSSGDLVLLSGVVSGLHQEYCVELVFVQAYYTETTSQNDECATRAELKDSL